MAKVLIIGAGGVGNVVTQKCAQVKEDKVTELDSVTSLPPSK